MNYDKSVLIELNARKEQDKETWRPKGKVSRTHKVKRLKIKICRLFLN